MLLAVFVFGASAVVTNSTARLSSSCSKQTQNTDYRDQQLCTYRTCPRTSNAAECCAECGYLYRERIADCEAAVFYDGVCYLKTGSSQPYSNPGRVGVVPVGDFPTPAPAARLSSGCSKQTQNIDYSDSGLCTWSNCPRTSNADDCCAKCGSTSGCEAATFYQGVCYLKTGSSQPFSSSGRVGVIPVGPAPTPAPGPTKATFMIIGDWGYSGGCHAGSIKSTCQGLIGNAMKEYAEQHDIKFVLNLGDSFYCDGVGSLSDPRWNENWYNVYGDLVKKPWFGVYGNHDYGGADACGCTEDYSGCVQMQATGKKDGWFMPNVTYFDTRYQDELDIEIIALDTNHMWPHSCQYTHYCSFQQCMAILEKRYEAAMELFYDRIERSTAKNLLVFTHYPSDYFAGDTKFMAALKDNSKHNIWFFGGHRHNTDQTSVASISPNTAWLVGGGGGYSCDGNQQGFVVGHVNEDYSITTESHLVSVQQCCNGRTGLEELFAEPPPSNACAMNPGCHAKGLTGDCCPAADGMHDKCCFDTHGRPELDRFLNETFVQSQSERRRR